MTTGPEAMLDAKAYLDTALKRIEQESFGQRAAPRVSLSADTHLDHGSGWTGTLEVRIRTRDGAEPIIQEERFAGIRSRGDVDDLLASTLSVLLMNHDKWPR
jgi:hypothetical protein